MNPPAKISSKNAPRVITDELLKQTHFEKLQMVQFSDHNNFDTHVLNNSHNNTNANAHIAENTEISDNINAENTDENAGEISEIIGNTPHYPTDEEIEAIQQEAWNSGHEVGFSTGYTEGLEKGLTEGFEQGKTEGLAEGKAEGLEIGKAEGLGIGRAEGFDIGEKEGRAKGEKEITEISTQVKALFNSIQTAMKNLESGIADELLHLALKIAKQVIRARITSGGDYLHFLVQDALRTLPAEHGTLNLRLNPDDLMNFRVYLEDNPSKINIITDKEISRGGCQINVGNTHIDATIENRWKRSIAPLGISDDWHDAGNGNQTEPIRRAMNANRNAISKNKENTQQNLQESQNNPNSQTQQTQQTTANPREK